jgi:hypothetical protein
MFHALREQCFQVIGLGGICGNDLAATLLCQLVDVSHPKCHGSIAEHEFGPFSLSRQGYLPGNGLIIQSPEYDTPFSL